MKHNTHTVMFKPTCDCNLNCKYCYDRPMRERFKGQKASNEVLEHTAKLMSEYAENVQWYWHGGEPTLMGKDYYLNSQKVFSKNYSTRFNQALQTNGLNVIKDTEGWAQTVIDCRIGMGFSFDLFGQANRSGDIIEIDDYENMLEDFKYLGGRDNIECVTVVTNKTISKLIQTYEHFKNRFGKDYILSLLLVFEIDESNPSGLGISPEEYIENYPKYLSHVFSDTSENALIDRYIRSYLLKLIGFDETSLCGFIECRRKWISVHPDGTVTHCDREPGVYYNLGNILDYNSIDDIYESDGYKKFECDCEERLNKYCRKCGYYEICNGGCHSNHGSVNGTRVNKVNPRECYTLQQNVLSIYDELQKITDKSLINPKVNELLQTHNVTLPYEIANIHPELEYPIDISQYRSRPLDFVNTEQFKLFRKLNGGNIID